MQKVMKVFGGALRIAIAIAGFFGSNLTFIVLVSPASAADRSGVASRSDLDFQFT
jgi:hypothetical protein